MRLGAFSMRSRSFLPFAVAAIATAVIAIHGATVEYEVTNAATKTATAWSSEFSTVDCRPTGRSRLTTDAYQTIEHAAAAKHALRAR